MFATLRRIRAAWAVLAVLTLVIAGCHTSAKNTTKQFPIRGKIVSVDPTGQSVSLDGEDIPGFMAPMVMQYKLEDPSVASELHPGDRIKATLLVDYDSAGPTNMRLHEVMVLAQAKPDYKPTVVYHIPAPGDVVPDFKLLNQSARTISLQQFRGKVLLMTFIYTRCPLADYCPRMSNNFASINKQLAADPAMLKKTHLLSVSFDPTYDTPKVLKSYGEAYTGRYVNETFDHWDFAAPSVAELPKMEQWFGVGVTPGENHTLQHSLSTVIIGKDGKIIAYLPTNDWNVQDVLKQVEQAAG